jgi:hypothetical protein
MAAALGALLASSGTLVCCVLPAVMVAMGAGATLASLVSAVPQLVWLSEHKVGVFAVAAGMLLLGAWSVWRARRAPCPVEPELARACLRLRRTSAGLLVVAALLFVVGGLFAWALPAFGA